MLEIQVKVEAKKNTKVRLLLQMENKVANFQHFEAIYGGGTELPSFPILVQTSLMLVKLFPPPITLQTPEPDESLPFQILTFVCATVAYLTLAIWRAYSNKN